MRLLTASPELPRAIPAANGGVRSGEAALPTLNRLRCFEAVVEESGFTRATARLHITQPALSYQIKHLEAEVGAQLFHRRPTGVSLTDAGRLLYTHAQRVSAAVREAQRAIQELPATGQLRVGTTNCIGTYFLPEVLCGLKERHPSMRPVLYRAPSDDMIEALLADEVDVAILADPREDRRLRYATLFEEQVSLVSGRSHRFFDAPAIRPEQLRGEQLVVQPQRTPTGALIRRYLDRLGLDFEPLVTVEDVETVKRMIETGAGVGFLPDMVTARDIVTPDNPAGRLNRSRIEPPVTRRVVLVAWSDLPASRAEAAFVAEVRRHVASAGPAAGSRV
jgi:DNA-binding transcriptional LysR family regulator